MFFQEEIFSPTCSEFFEDLEHSLAEVNYENRSYLREKSTLFIPYQREVIFLDFQDPFDTLLQALEKMNDVSFVNISLGFNFYYEFPTYTSLCLLEESESRILVSSHLLDWLHWKDHFT